MRDTQHQLGARRWLCQLWFLWCLLAICVVPRAALGFYADDSLRSGGVTASSRDATDLPHARGTSHACEHAFAGEVAPPQAISSTIDVVSRLLASPRMARVGAGKYDAFGRRIKKTKYDPARTAPVTTLFTWDGEVLAAETDTEQGPRTFVHAPGSFEPILQQQNGEVFLCVNDHLGMPKDLVASDGAIAWSATHSAYGRVIASYADDTARARHGTTIASPFRLLGQVADDDAELCFTRYRCFDPEIGSWITSDPLEIAGGLNLYGFDGAPTDVVDPLGLAAQTGPVTHGGDTKLYRGMTADGDAPKVGDSARTLGVRAGEPPVVDGMVHPGTGGMSVSPGSPENLPPHRRPPEFGGTGKDPVWAISQNDLGPDLVYRPDPKNPTGHGFIEPARSMPLSDYQKALAATQPQWQQV